jgi:hypothetical protein
LEAAADAWQALTEEAAAASPEKQPSSEQRREALREALDKVDIVRLAELTKRLSGLVEQLLANPIDTETECDEAELARHLEEHLAFQELADLIKLRYDARRARIFGRITADHIANAVDDPDHAPGEVEVPGTERKFTREGGKPKLKLDENKLRGLLSGEQQNRVFTVEMVKPKIVLDQDALIKLVAEAPELMDVVRQCIISVGHNPSSFHVRNLEG